MKKYTEIMEHIRPNPEQKSRMLERVLHSKPERRSFKLRYAAAVIAAGIVFSGTVFGEEIKNTFYGLLGKDEIISGDVLTDVYTDSSEHIRMSVKEVLSDKISSYAIVEYIALDGEGQEWLDSFMTATDKGQPDICPYMKEENTFIYGVNYSFGCEEIEDYCTENRRVFKAEYEASGENFGTDAIRLWYCLDNEWGKEAIIDVTESVPLTDIKLDSSNAPEKYYKPLGVKISPMSILIYGKDMGMVETGRTKSGGCYQKVINNEEISSLYLVMKNGTEYNMLSPEGGFEMGQCGWQLSAVSNPEVDYDCAIYAGSFKESVDISLIDGIKLDGVFYPFGL